MTNPQATAILKHHAKTFYWAWLFLPRGSRAATANLYAFCREVDDIADELGDHARLLDLRAMVAAGREPRLHDLEARGVRREWMLDLIDGALSDLDFKDVETEAELDLYCYRVAGVVGLMMCPLLGVLDPAAHQHAVDLGSAMQLTNIARDVAEDLQRGRTYVPRAWGGAKGAGVTQRLLTKAEGLYRSGAQGLRFIPWRTRISVKLARALYREIGAALAKQDYDPFRGRAFVPWWQKVIVSVRTLLNQRMNYENVAHNLVWLRLSGDGRDGGDARA